MGLFPLTEGKTTLFPHAATFDICINAFHQKQMAMELFLFISLKNQLNPVIGVIAFLFTALYLIISFPLHFKLIAGCKGKDAYWVMACLVLVFIVEILWLVYLWPIGNVLVKVTLGLNMISSLVFLFQSTWMKARR